MRAYLSMLLSLDYKVTSTVLHDVQTFYFLFLVVSDCVSRYSAFFLSDLRDTLPCLDFVICHPRASPSLNMIPSDPFASLEFFVCYPFSLIFLSIPVSVSFIAGGSLSLRF